MCFGIGLAGCLCLIANHRWLFQVFGGGVGEWLGDTRSRHVFRGVQVVELETSMRLTIPPPLNTYSGPFSNATLKPRL
jgi:hypothetical protein